MRVVFLIIHIFHMMIQSRLLNRKIKVQKKIFENLFFIIDFVTSESVISEMTVVPHVTPDLFISYHHFSAEIGQP